MMTRENGVTIVALVITIILFIILAGVTTNAMIGDNGIITIAQEAKQNMVNAAEEENILIQNLWNELQGMTEDEEEIEIPVVPNSVREAKITGVQFENTTVILDELSNEIVIPGNFKVTSDSGIEIEEGIVIEDEKGNQFVWIPVGIYHTTSRGKE